MAGATEEEHFRIIAEVLGKLDQHGMTVNKAKCAKPQIGFCGHLIDADGLHKSQEKIKAVSGGSYSTKCVTVEGVSRVSQLL